MKASEVISRLETMIERYGDQIVAVPNVENGVVTVQTVTDVASGKNEGTKVVDEFMILSPKTIIALNPAFAKV